jgi:hypothetical protein
LGIGECESEKVVDAQDYWNNRTRWINTYCILNVQFASLSIEMTSYSNPREIVTD